MNKFEERFFNLLVRRYGFYIKDYFSNVKSENKWIAITENKEFAYCVIVCDEGDADACYNEASNAVKTLVSKPAVVNVVITKVDDTTTYPSASYSSLVYSLKEKRVVYSHEGCKPLIEVCEYMDKSEQNKRNRRKESKVTYMLIAINILIFIISAIYSRDIMDINTYVLVRMGAKVNELINHGQVWRLFTCAFLHGGLIHIAFNMYALKIIGSEVEYAYGAKKYLLIYAISALGGSAFSYIFSKYSISVGASGAIFGFLGAMLIFGYKHKDRIGKAYMMNLVQVIVINIIIGVTISNIDNFAHLGGLIAGVIMAWICKSKLELKSN